MRWEELPQVVDELAEKTAEVAWAVKAAVADVFTTADAGYYYCPARDQVALFAPACSCGQQSMCKSAATRAVGVEHVRQEPMSLHEVCAGAWIKVAYSPTLRRVGELLNFFEGKYPGGIPNAPSPVAAMLTTGLVGGGLGYGAGWLGEKMLPDGYGKKLKRTGAALGAMAGMVIPAAWGVGNYRNNKSLLDPWPFNERPGDRAAANPGYDELNPDPATGQPPGWVAPYVDKGVPPLPKPGVLHKLKLGSMVTRALEEFTKKASMGDFGGGYAEQAERTPYDVNVNHLGQTLWEAGASQPLLGATMGAVYAAQQMPDGDTEPGWVSGNQLGQLAKNVGKDYLSGLALGALINTAVGTPYSAPAFGLGGAALGLVRAGIKSLFS